MTAERSSNTSKILSLRFIVILRLIDYIAHPSVGYPDDAVGVPGVCLVVRDHDQRCAAAAHLFAEQFEHLFACVRIKVAGRLIGKEYLGLSDKRARN
ncbi:hypothetical protein SDC9_148036 [bioreactor metagenome]|uniref:Uncharacterized protein n=1 Tax=bioreactor metagenome TaxID=1076179 RepID=A0A645EFR7_9ZZZZ